MASGQKFVFAVTRLQGHAFTSMMRYQIEALGFLKRRYEQDVTLVDDLIETEDVNKAFDICAGFVEKAMAEYSAQAGKVATMSSELASEATERMQKCPLSRVGARQTSPERAAAPALLPVGRSRRPHQRARDERKLGDLRPCRRVGGKLDELYRQLSALESIRQQRAAGTNCSAAFRTTPKGTTPEKRIYVAQRTGQW